MALTFTDDDVSSSGQAPPAPRPITFSAADIATPAPKPAVASVTFHASDVAVSQPAQAKPVTFSASDIAANHGPTSQLNPPPEQLIPSNTTIRAYKPSVWDRIKSVFESGNPNYSSYTPSNPKYGSMQLISPEEALSPVEQANHPIVSGILETGGSLTTPGNIATIAATGGLGELPGAAGKIIPRLVSAGFSGQMIYQSAKQVPAVMKALEAGDYSTAENLLTKIVLQGGMAALGVKHAATGKGAFSGKATPAETAPVPSEVKLTAGDSPVNTVIGHPVPEARIVESEAAKQSLENSVRPQNGQPNGETQRTEDNAPTARIVSDNHLPIVTKSEILNEATQRIIQNAGTLADLGIDPERIESPQDVQAALDKAAGKIQQNLDPRVGATISLDAQKSLAAEVGMSVDELLSRKSGESMNAEHAIAARALLKDSQTRVMNLARNAATGDEDYLEQFNKALSTHQEILNQVKGVTSEAGRALGSFRVKENELPQLKIANALSDLPEDSQQKAAQLLSKIDPSDIRAVNQFVEEITPSSTPDKIYEYYRNSLLSSPHTVLVKGASELSMMALEATKKAVAGGVSKAKSLFSGDPQEHYASEAYWYSKGAIQAMQKIPLVLKGQFDLAGMPDFESTGKRAIKGTVGKIVRTPGTILSRQTNSMYVLNYFGELNALAARAAIKEGLSGQDLYARQEYLAQNPTPDMEAGAHDQALYNTFQNDLGKVGQKFQRALQGNPVSKFLFPFYRTPVNLVKASADFSPYGLLKGIAKGDADATARGLIGSSIAAGLAYATLQGRITTGGGPVNVGERKTLEATGWQPYSVKIGGKYYSYHRAEPLGLVMSLVADAVHGLALGNDPESPKVKSAVDNVLQHIGRNLQDLPFMFELSEISRFIGDTTVEGAEKFAGQFAASFVPQGVSNIAQIADDNTVRKPKTLPQFFQNRIPGQRQNVPPELDITGKPVQSPASSFGGANPFPVSEENNDLQIAQAARLGIPTELNPKKPDKDFVAAYLKRQKLTSLLDMYDKARLPVDQDLLSKEIYSKFITWRRDIPRSLKEGSLTQPQVDQINQRYRNFYKAERERRIGPSAQAILGGQVRQ